MPSSVYAHYNCYEHAKYMVWPAGPDTVLPCRALSHTNDADLPTHACACFGV